MCAQTLRDLFQKSAARHGEKEAILFYRRDICETRLTYGQLEIDSSRLANVLIGKGIKPGARVVFYLPKSIFGVVAHIAVQKIGAVGVPLNPGFKPAELSYLIDDCRPSLAICEPDMVDTLRKIDPRVAIMAVDTKTLYQDIDFFRSASENCPQVEINADDSGLIVYTSGTTGKPKGAVLTQKNLIHDALNIIRIWEINSADTLCHALPLFHVHGLCFALHTALLVGAKIQMLSLFFSPQIIQMLAEVDRERKCTLFMGVPAMYTKLMDDIGDKRIDFSHIRLLTSGSAPLSVKEFKRIRQVFGKEPVEREGMSETGMNFSNPIIGQRKPGAIGLPLPGLDVRIVDVITSEDLPSGGEGEIWLKGPGITPGYWEKPEETRRAFQNGWFRTGDLGKVDADGYYYLTDRIKHIIISGGENISPKEVEAVIDQIEGVVESAVVGLEDSKWGEMVVVAVVLQEENPASRADIEAVCRRQLHDWKCPKKIHFVKALPRNSMGKVLKGEVKRFFK